MDHEPFDRSQFDLWGWPYPDLTFLRRNTILLLGDSVDHNSLPASILSPTAITQVPLLQQVEEIDCIANGNVPKVLVLSGSPTDKVFETFKSMYSSQTGLATDGRSYIFLLLLICDSGLMDQPRQCLAALRRTT
ncbi:hypothetical protein VP01_1105g4 [Puccinia sorghi]|uniref:Uncharacterized protein n=1 Tax=Puccinia sorghi TaxID=27349 RepID=A0A0L6VSR0_9BASI|nr:hypothetical protein VP01_1105g4 [Puccinia sorghi]